MMQLTKTPILLQTGNFAKCRMAFLCINVNFVIKELEFCKIAQLCCVSFSRERKFERRELRENMKHITRTSVGLGALIGSITALMTKFTHIKDFPLLETSLFFLMSYSSYLLAEICEMSGIVSILFCGIFQVCTSNILATKMTKMLGGNPFLTLKDMGGGNPQGTHCIRMVSEQDWRLLNSYL